MKVLCIVTALMFALMSPTLGNAAPHCSPSTVPIGMHEGHKAAQVDVAVMADHQHLDHSGAGHQGMGHQSGGHQNGGHAVPSCCLTMCGLQTAIAPLPMMSTSFPAFVASYFPDLPARLFGHLVSPAFEPPRFPV